MFVRIESFEVLAIRREDAAVSSQGDALAGASGDVAVGLKARPYADIGMLALARWTAGNDGKNNPVVMSASL